MERIREKKYYYYEGEKVNLRGIEKEDYTDRMYRWANDPEFNHYLSHGLRPTTVEMMESLYDDLIGKENVIFAIVDKENKETIGIVGLHHIDRQIRSAEYTIHIGEKAYWGSGTASESTDFVLKYAFETLNLNKVWLGVVEPNSKAVGFYEKKGFVREGELRDEVFRENRYFSSIRMSMLRKDYEKR